MKKVLFVIRSLELGGITTSLVNLLDHIEETGKDNFDIDVLTFAQNPSITLPDYVEVLDTTKNLNLAVTSFYEIIKSKKILNIIKRILLIIEVRIIGPDKFFRKELKKIAVKDEYDSVIAFSNDIPGSYFHRGATLFASDFTNAPEKITWVHNDPEKLGFDRAYCEKLYRDFSRIVCVSGAVKEQFDAIFSGNECKTEVIYNFFNHKKILKQAGEYIPFKSPDVYNIVTVCRIDNKSKRTDAIAKVCKRLKNEGINGFKWRIVGDGPELNQNIALAKKLDVVDVLEFVGEKTNPLPYMLHSDLFALYSAYEGHPMVIGEAIATGTYILTTNYAAATEQIDSQHGIIAISDEDFYQQIKTLIRKKSEETKYDTIIKRNSFCV